MDVASLGSSPTCLATRTSPARKISDQLGHAKISMTQDRYLGRRLTDRQTAEVLEDMLTDDTKLSQNRTLILETLRMQSPDQGR